MARQFETSHRHPWIDVSTAPIGAVFLTNFCVGGILNAVIYQNSHGLKEAHMNANKRGVFVSLESISGGGKSTLAEKWLVPFLETAGINCVRNAEPSSANAFGITIRMAIEHRIFAPEHIKNLSREIVRLFKVAHSSGKNQKVSDYFRMLAGIPEKLERNESLTELDRQFLFLADSFFDVTEIIVPQLNRGNWIVQDRFHLSGPAYGSAKGELTIKEIYEWRSTVLRERHIVPDITFFIDVSPETAVRRLKASGKVIDLYEGSESLRKIRTQYENAILLVGALEGKRSKVVRVNGELPIEQVFEEIKRALEEKGLV